MFRFHQHTRRRICRGLFLCGCIAPILALIAWAVSLHLAGHARSHEAELSRRLGMRVTFDDISYPRPGATRYRGLSFSNAETAELLLHVDSLDAHVADGALVLSAVGAEIEVGRLASVWEVIAQGLRTPAEQQVRLLAERVVLRDDTTTRVFTDVEGDWDPSETGMQASLRFGVKGVSMQSPARVRVIRNRQTVPPSTRFELDTSGAPLPCALVVSLFPQLARFGPDSRFRGYLWATEQAAGWDAEWAGELTGVDLARLVTDQFPHRLSGTAKIIVQRARMHQGRLDQATGSLTAGPGQVSPSLLSAAVDALYLVPGNVTRSTLGDVPYDQLSLAFDVSDTGLSIRGICRDVPPGTVLTSRSAALLAEPRHERLPVVSLIRMLVPRIEVLVPATRETDILTQLLPLPRIPRQHQRTVKEPPSGHTSP